jgi:hypothetical protein
MLITGGAGFVDFYATGYYTKRREGSMLFDNLSKRVQHKRLDVGLSFSSDKTTEEVLKIVGCAVGMS